jgi:hypothetical protein
MERAVRPATGLAIGIALAGLLVWPGSVPGLHGDEAWSLLRINEIMAGRHRLDGMNHYTGVLHHYLALPLVALLGPIPSALRLTGAILNVLALLALLALLARLDAHRPMVRIWTPLLIATSANFIIQSRFAIEVTMLTPLLVFAAGALLVRAVTRADPAGAAGAFVGGMLLGLSIYSHLLAAGVVGGLGLGALAAFGWRVVIHPFAVWLAAGVLAGCVPRFVSLVLALQEPRPQSLATVPAGATGIDIAAMWGTITGYLGDLAYLPIFIGRLLDGDLLFLRTTGQLVLAVLPLMSLSLVAFGGLSLLRRPWTIGRVDRGLIVAFLASVVLTFIITPQLSLRYFSLHALVAIYLLVRLVAAWSEAGAGRRIVAHTLLGTIALAQAAYVTTNYFGAFRRTGGLEATFPIGFRLRETSSHFVRSDGLYRDLGAAGIREAYANDLLAWSLAAYDLPHRTTAGRSVGGGQWPPQPAHPASAAITFFASERMPDGRMAGDAADLLVGGQTLVRAAGFDPRFAVFRWTSPKAPAP